MAEYIGKASALKKINDCYLKNEVYDSEVDIAYAQGYNDGLKKAAGKICSEKADDVAPVVHGNLVSTGFDELLAEFGRCTVCNGECVITAKFCNWCGAKMDLEVPNAQT